MEPKENKLIAKIEKKNTTESVGSFSSPEVSVQSYINSDIEKINTSFPDDEADITHIKSTIGLSDKNLEAEIISQAGIPIFGEKLKKIYDAAINRLSNLKDGFSRGARKTTLAGILMATSLQANSREIHSQEEIEGIRIHHMEILKNGIAEEKELLRVSNDKNLFSESFKNTKINKNAEYIQSLSESGEKIKLMSEDLTEDEIELLIRNISQKPIFEARIEKEEKEGLPPDPKADSVDENLYSYTQQHTKVVEILENLKKWSKSDEKDFNVSVAKINSFDPNEKPSDVFKEAVDQVTKNHITSAQKYLQNEITQDKIDEAWNDRPSSEFLKLDIIAKENELSNIDKNLHEDDLRKFVDSSRDEVAEYISSPKYFRKLVDIEGMSEDSAKVMQEKRVHAVKNISYTIAPQYQNSSRVDIDMNGKAELVYNAYDLAHAPKQNASHELIHIALGGDENITQNERKIFESARINPKEYDEVTKNPLAPINELISGTTFNPHPDEHILSPAELAPRKYVLEKEMERLGIKKIFEPMTHEHYIKIKKLMETGTLNHNVVQIILGTSEEGLLKIMNEIALNETDPKSNKDTA